MPASSPVLLPLSAEPVCLDFANTLFWRGSSPPTETLNTPEDLLAWSGKAGLPGVDAVRALWQVDPGAAEAGLLAVRDLRETIYRLLAAPAPADLAAFNRALAAGPERRRLDMTEQGFAWRCEAWTPEMPSLLAPVVWSVVDLLADPRRARVRTCANPKCGWLFFDDSKAGNRRWCSMAACGNRAKAHRHYARQRGRNAEAPPAGR